MIALSMDKGWGTALMTNGWLLLAKLDKLVAIVTATPEPGCKAGLVLFAD